MPNVTLQDAQARDLLKALDDARREFDEALSEVSTDEEAHSLQSKLERAHGLYMSISALLDAAPENLAPPTVEEIQARDPDEHRRMTVASAAVDHIRGAQEYLNAAGGFGATAETLDQAVSEIRLVTGVTGEEDEEQ